MIRESSVVSGTEFLSHPAVIPHSREEKVSFLRGKGLTAEEIEEAFKRIEALHPTAAPATAAPASPPQAQPGYPGGYPVVPQPPPPQEEPWSFLANVVAPASLALSAGASALYFYKTYISHETGPQGGGVFPWEAQGGGAGLAPPPLLHDPM